MKREKETKDVNLQTDKTNSRRSLLKKTIIGVPVVMTLANKPAFGAICSISGFQSVNPSGVGDNGGCGGISPGGWKENGYKSGNQDGNRNQWIAAGFYPNPRVGVSYQYKGKKESSDDPAGTLFFAAIAFQGVSPTVEVSATDTLHDVLLKNPGSLEFHVISNFLNAHYFGWGNGDGKILADDIRGVYFAYTSSASTYTTVGGTTIDLTGFDLQDFFDQLYH
jgi:hypothetical protein